MAADGTVRAMRVFPPGPRGVAQFKRFVDDHRSGDQPPVVGMVDRTSSEDAAGRLVEAMRREGCRVRPVAGESLGGTVCGVALDGGRTSRRAARAMLPRRPVVTGRIGEPFRGNRDRGVSFVESLIAVFLVGLLAVAALPAMRTWIDDARLSAATSRMTLLFRRLRSQAVANASCRGVVFDMVDGSVIYRVVEDGNGNGIRRSDVEDGVDPVVDGPVSLPDEHGGVRFGILDTCPVPVLPPGHGALDDPHDPIRFGSSDLVSFTPLGASSSGTVYLLSPGGRMRAVSLYGVTGRIRVWDFLPGRSAWARR
jgi:type II secretory pathway pseudopilin PulG